MPDLSHSINGARHNRLGIRRELLGDGGRGAAKTAMPTFLRNSRRSFSASSRSSSFSLFIAMSFKYWVLANGRYLRRLRRTSQIAATALAATKPNVLGSGTSTNPAKAGCEIVKATRSAPVVIKR